MKNAKQRLVKEYVELSYRLGRLASIKDCENFGLSRGRIRHLYGDISSIKKEAVALSPDLENIRNPSPITHSEVQRHRLDIEKRITNAQNKSVVESGSFFDYVKQFSDNVFKGTIKVKPPFKAKKIKRVHTLVLSDLHFGSDLKGDETGTADYGIIEEARRFASVIREAATYKKQYRKDTKLIVVLAGDIIENSMHDPRTGAVIAEQCCRAIHLLTQGIAYLAQFYPEVQVECATGNHDRITSRHHGRAVHQKFDSYSTIIYYAIKSSLAGNKHITVNIPKTPLSSYTVFGKRIGVTHGDTVIKTGGVYSTVNVKSLEAQVNKINSALPDKEEYAAIIYGHLHILHTIFLNNGCVLIGNGALPPPDPFAVSIGNFESNNGQWMFESVEGHPVGDMRAIRTGREYDKDASLDKIIKPWEKY